MRYTLKEQSTAGFTMIEVIAVLILLGVLTAITLNHSGTIIQGNNLALESDILKNTLRYIQIRAMNSEDSAIWRLQMTADGTGYQISQNSAPTLASPSWSPRDIPGEDESNKGTHIFSNGVTAVNHGQSIYFNAWGIPVDSSGARVSGTTTLNLQQGSNTKGPNVAANTGHISQ